MGKVKQAYMAATEDDMGGLEEAQKLNELSKYTVEELTAELDSRGWKVVSK